MNELFLTAQVARATGDGPFGPLAIMVFLGAILVFGFFMTIIKCYRRCPSNKILVMWGKGTGKQSAKTVHGGAAFIVPVIQDYAYLSLDPLQIEIPLKGALSAENIRVNVPSVFTVAIGTEPVVMQNAAIRLLGLGHEEITGRASDIIFGQLRQVIASMAIDEINRDRDKFLQQVQLSLEPELEKIGLVLINVNITDITDDSGYIDAIGRKAASAAIQQAEVDVADQQRSGAIGVAKAMQQKAVEVANAEKARDIGTKQAEREKAVRVAELQKEQTVGIESAKFLQEASIKDAEREMRISLANANAAAVTGENLAKAKVADAEAELAIRQAEAFQASETKKREAAAAVKEAQYRAEAKAAVAASEKIEQEKRAELEAPAIAEKARVMVQAEAEAEKRRIEAEGEAKAIYLKLEAEARGNYEILSKKAEGLGEIVKACGGAQAAFQLMMLEHMESLSQTAATAISNIKFDKVIVWENGGGNGQGSTAGFLQNMAKTLPPMLQIMQEIGGVQMPEYFGKMVDPEKLDKAATANGPAPAHSPLASRLSEPAGPPPANN